jgi:hypothetical protein
MGDKMQANTKIIVVNRIPIPPANWKLRAMKLPRLLAFGEDFKHCVAAH